MGKFLKKFRHGEKGFTLIELLVVVAVLGVLAAVAIPNVGKFIGQGKTESYETELHNVQTAVMAMLADSDDGTITTTAISAATATGDMTAITATVGGAGVDLADYMAGLDAGSVKSDCTYYFGVGADDMGTVFQITP